MTALEIAMAGCLAFGQPAEASSDHYCEVAVGSDKPVMCNENTSGGPGLRNQKSVERIGVDRRKTFYRRAVLGGNSKLGKPCSDKQFPCARGVEGKECGILGAFYGDFPYGGRAEEICGIALRENVSSFCGQLCRVERRPDEQMGVNEIFHSDPPLKRLAISASIASKSASKVRGRLYFPSASPNLMRDAVRTGVSRLSRAFDSLRWGASMRNGMPPLMATAQMKRFTAAEVVRPTSEKIISAALRLSESTRAVIIDVIKSPLVCQLSSIVSQPQAGVNVGRSVFDEAWRHGEAWRMALSSVSRATMIRRCLRLEGANNYGNQTSLQWSPHGIPVVSMTS